MHPSPNGYNAELPRRGPEFDSRAVRHRAGRNRIAEIRAVVLRADKGFAYLCFDLKSGSTRRVDLVQYC